MVFFSEALRNDGGERANVREDEGAFRLQRLPGRGLHAARPGMPVV